MTDPQPAEATATIASQSIELRLTGKPDVKNKWGAGSIRPRFVVFTYLPEGIRAHLYGVWVREDGELTDAPCDQDYRIGDTDDWPDWMAELASEHDPRTAPALQAPATDQAALRDRIAEALAAVLAECDAIEADYRDQHDEVGVGARAAIIRIRARVAVLEQQPAVLPAPADRADVLREAADGFDRHAAQLLDGVGDKAVFVAKALRDQAAVWSEAAETLRRLAAASAVVVRRATDETPGVRHAPGVAILCPDCRAKGHSVCMDGEAPAATPPAVGAPQLVCKCPAEICQCGHRQAQQPKEAQPPTAYSDGKGRTYCLPCAPTVGADVPLTINDVDLWDLCPSCGRHVVDVARAAEQPKEA